jgi:hypothetical protein
MDDARAVTHYGYLPLLIRIEDAGKYRRLLARRSAGQLKLAS